MHRRDIFALSMITPFGFAWLGGSADAQEKSFKQLLVGTWMLVACEAVARDGTKSPLVTGDHPAGQYIFTDDGHFSFQETAELSKVVSDDRMKTTPSEDKAVVQGSIAYYGTYTVNDADKTIAVHIERSSFPNLNGTDGKRIVTTLSADEMSYVNPRPMARGTINCTFKRAKQRSDLHGE